MRETGPELQLQKLWHAKDKAAAVSFQGRSAKLTTATVTAEFVSNIPFHVPVQESPDSTTLGRGPEGSLPTPGNLVEMSTK